MGDIEGIADRILFCEKRMRTKGNLLSDDRSIADVEADIQLKYPLDDGMAPCSGELQLPRLLGTLELELKSYMLNLENGRVVILTINGLRLTPDTSIFTFRDWMLATK